MMKKFISAILAVAMVASMSMTVFAADSPETYPFNEDEYTQTKPVQRIGSSTRMSPEIGKCSVEYNSTFNWARAVTAVWDWGRVISLYAEVNVTARGSTPIVQTKSTTTSRSITTDKADQPNKTERQVRTAHTVEGYHIGHIGSGADPEYKLEYYGETWNF